MESWFILRVYHYHATGIFVFEIMFGISSIAFSIPRRAHRLEVQHSS